MTWYGSGNHQRGFNNGKYCETCIGCGIPTWQELDSRRKHSTHKVLTKTETHSYWEIIRRIGNASFILIAATLLRLPFDQARAQTLTTLYNFTGGSSGGKTPLGALARLGATLCGTTGYGGSAGTGTVFEVTTGGSFSLDDSLTSSTGDYPVAGLIISGSTFYGVTTGGGANNFGTVFKVQDDGSSFTVLHSFTATDGYGPVGSLVLLGTNLYGTAYHEGPYSGNYGTVFVVDTDGVVFNVLHGFQSTDGCNPATGMVLSGTTLYGTTYAGGAHNDGTIFSINTDGSGFTGLHSFAGTSDGQWPESELVGSGTNL
ncbi:MAG: choice-of-anchor tandem repeat GloVer-containing protein [Verrucomicrobiota bacterium]